MFNWLTTQKKIIFLFSFKISRLLSLAYLKKIAFKKLNVHRNLPPSIQFLALFRVILRMRGRNFLSGEFNFSLRFYKYPFLALIPRVFINSHNLFVILHFLRFFCCFDLSSQKWHVIERSHY